MPEPTPAAPRIPIRTAGPAPRASLARRAARWAGRAVLGGLALALLGVVTVFGLFLYYGRDLPTFEAVTDYRPPLVSRVYDRQGRPVAEYFRERRTLVPPDQIPQVLKQAVVAAEDAAFYQHKGLDYVGIARALVKDVQNLSTKQGASTITQQVVKNLVLSPERSVARKVKEAILAQRLERNLSKEEILYLYLMHINFGHGRYGVEEASQFYFGKPVTQVTLGEAALLAGLPQSPTYLSPLRYPDKARARQAYVLGQMAENNFITREQADAELARPIELAPEPMTDVGPYYAEEVRKQLVARYGEQLVLEGGLRVQLAMDRDLQVLCDKALQSGLEQLDRRIGVRGAEALVLPPPLLEGVRGKWRGRERAAPTRKPLLPVKATANGKNGANGAGKPAAREMIPAIWDFSRAVPAALESPEALSKVMDERPLTAGVTTVAPVAALSDTQVTVDLGSTLAAIPFESMRWARKPGAAKGTPSPKRPADVLAEGQLIRVRLVEAGARSPSGAPPAVRLELVPIPQVQGALVAVDPTTRQVVALSGGYDFELSSFNRATQAHRQPGSSFKPFVYAAALASGRFTAASILNDAPDLFRDPWTGKEWKPQNFERDAFEGPMNLREALSKSKNTISVRLIEAIGPQAVIDMATRAGITSPMPENMTLALGTAEVTPLELANAYATFATLGQRAEPILIEKVADATGRVLEEHHAVAEETIPPAVAFITTSLMQSVIESGTGVQASELNRPVAGKTGTASENRDAWFAAFTPDLVAVAWAGFDDHSPLGGSETGGRAALPIWLEFMKGAMEKRPVLEFNPPAGIESVRIDPKSGLRAADDAPGRTEYFVEGSAPKEFATRPGEADPGMLFLEDGGRGPR